MFWNNKSTKYKEFNSEIVRNNQETPDAWNITRKPFHRVFLYDNMMKSHPEHDNFFKGAAEYLAVGFVDERFSLWKKHLGKASFAVPLHGDSEINAPIKGEMYKLSTDYVFALDKIYNNGVEYERIRTLVQIPQREVKFLKEPVEIYSTDKSSEPELQSIVTVDANTKSYWAWMYVGRSNYWDEQMKSSLVMIDHGHGHTKIRGNSSHTSNAMFTPVRRFISKKTGQPYYYFSIKEYED